MNIIIENGIKALKDQIVDFDCEIQINYKTKKILDKILKVG